MATMPDNYQANHCPDLLTVFNNARGHATFIKKRLHPHRIHMR
jgi:hypothetical protein